MLRSGLWPEVGSCFRLSDWRKRGLLPCKNAVNVAVYYYFCTWPLSLKALCGSRLFCFPGGFIYTFTAEMLYIPERDSCTVWTANNTPLQRDSETLYRFPSSANIDCWQVQSSHDDDTWTWYKHHHGQTSSGIAVFLTCTVQSLRSATPVKM